MLVARKRRVPELSLILICGTLIWIAAMAAFAKPVGEMMKRAYREHVLFSESLCVWLVVDDDRARSALLAALAQERLHVEVADSEERACAMLRAAANDAGRFPDLIIADVKPTEMLATIGALGCEVPVLLAADVISVSA